MKLLSAFALFLAVAISSAIAQTPPTIASVSCNGNSTSWRVTEGQSATFVVTATGPNRTYQWRKAISTDGSGGTPIAGATGDTFTIAAVTTSDNTSYGVTVTNSAGSVNSTYNIMAVIAATPPSYFGQQPSSVTVYVGQTISVFAGVINGSLPFTYTWRRSGVDVAVTTIDTYTKAGATVADAGTYTVTTANVKNSVTSSPFTITVIPAPVFATSPSNVTIPAGNTFQLEGSVTLPDNVSYQWYKDGSSIPGATSRFYTTGLAGSYVLYATNPAGTTASSPGVLTVTAAPAGPVFSSHPTSVSRYAGESVTFTAAATGTGTVSYQWRKAGANIAGATGASFTINNVQAADAASYSVVATDGQGSTASNSATLTVVASAAPVITGHPSSQVSGVTGSVSFTVTASANPAPTYQWRKDGNAIAGATSATLSFPSLVASDAGTYSVLVTNAVGSAVSNGASLTIYDQIPSAPSFTTQPQNRAAGSGQTVTLTVAVSGFPTPTLQWYKAGSAISGATSATLNLGAMTPALAGDYSVVASNPLGTTQSTTSTLSYSVSSFTGTYFGTMGSGESWALKVFGDGTATFLGYLSGPGKIIYAANLLVGPTGGVSFGKTGAATTSISPRSISDGVLAAADVALADRYFNGPVTLQITGTAVTGQISGIAGSFAGAVVATSPVTATITGTYDAVPLGSGLGEIHAVVGGDGGLLLVAVDASGVRGGMGTVSSTGAFTVIQPQFTYSGNLMTSRSALSGTYSPVGGTAVEIAPPPAAGNGRERLVNVSTRGMAGTDSKTLIVGFVVAGSGPQDLLLRAVGPTLGTLGVGGVLTDPRLKLYKAGVAALENDDWMLGGAAVAIAAAGSRLGAYPLNNGSADAALLARLDPGVYSAHVSANNGVSGVALMEVYDASASGSTGPKVVNLSARGSVASGDDILIIGFVIDGTTPKKMLVRGLGPSLTAAGVDGALADPKLQLFRAGVKVNENDNWSSGAETAEVADAAHTVGAFEIKTGTKDAALLVYLAPGVYSAHVSGVNNTAGVALVEVYEVP